MTSRTPTISTTVRFKAHLTLIRLAFRVGNHIVPSRLVDYAARLFTTPMASSRSRARAAPLLGAMEATLAYRWH